MSTRSELRSLQNELYSIITELRGISAAMQSETKGLYMHGYADKVDDIANEYQRYYNTLRNARIVEKD